MIDLSLARRKNYRALRESSWDRQGGNEDALRIAAGETRTLSIATPGVPPIPRDHAVDAPARNSVE